MGLKLSEKKVLNEFIDEMYEKHDYKKDELKKLFNQIKEEKKL